MLTGCTIGKPYLTQKALFSTGTVSIRVSLVSQLNRVGPRVGIFLSLLNTMMNYIRSVYQKFQQMVSTAGRSKVMINVVTYTLILV